MTLSATSLAMALVLASSPPAMINDEPIHELSYIYFNLCATESLNDALTKAQKVGAEKGLLYHGHRRN